MNKRKTLIITALTVILVAGFSLHWYIIPDVIWSNGGGAYTGWMAIIRAWPIWLISGSCAAILGMLIGLLFGETARVEDYQTRATKAEEIAENATASAESLLAGEHARLQRQQEEAKRQIALAQSERKTAAQEIERYRDENTKIRAGYEQVAHRLQKSLAAQERGKEREKKLKESPTSSLEAAHEEVWRHQNILADINRLPWTSGLDFGQPHWIENK